LYYNTYWNMIYIFDIHNIYIYIYIYKFLHEDEYKSLNKQIVQITHIDWI